MERQADPATTVLEDTTMDLFTTMPVWALALSIFLLRIVDVSLGTVRTIFVVQGRMPFSVAIGFVEVLFWVTAVSQVIVRVQDDPVLILAFAAGFAAGNACGIVLEQRLNIGRCVVRMIVRREAEAIAARLRAMGHAITSFEGRGEDGPRTLMFTACSRRELQRIISTAASLEPGLFYTVDRFSRSGQLDPLPHPTGWRAVLKKK